MKKIGLWIMMYCIWFASQIFASNAPGVVCNGLPGCSSDGVWEVDNSVGGQNFFSFLWNLISEWIKYVAVLAVLALIIAGIMYLTSAWEEEKVKKAKSAIIWSLVWVLLSTSAWAIINVINSFSIK